MKAITRITLLQQTDKERAGQQKVPMRALEMI